MQTEDPLRAHLERIVGMSLPDYHVFQRSLSTLTVEAGNLLFNVGTTDRNFYILIDGIVGVGIPTGTHSEWIRRFVGRGELLSSTPAIAHPVMSPLAGSLAGIAGAVPSTPPTTTYRARAISRVRTRMVDARVFWALAQRHRQWLHLALVAAIASSAAQEKRELELLTMTAEERYRALIEDRPELVGLVPQKDLARYVGVTPVAMSRIASRIRTGQQLKANAHLVGDASSDDQRDAEIDAG